MDFFFSSSTCCSSASLWAQALSLATAAILRSTLLMFFFLVASCSWAFRFFFSACTFKKTIKIYKVSNLYLTSRHKPFYSVDLCKSAGGKIQSINKTYIKNNNIYNKEDIFIPIYTCLQRIKGPTVMCNIG